MEMMMNHVQQQKQQQQQIQWHPYVQHSQLTTGRDGGGNGWKEVASQEATGGKEGGAVVADALQHTVTHCNGNSLQHVATEGGARVAVAREQIRGAETHTHYQVRLLMYVYMYVSVSIYIY